MLPELRAFAAFYGTKRSLYPGDEHAAQIVGKLILGQYVRVAERVDGVPVGFLAASLIPHWLNPEIRVAAEVFWWVPVEHRRSLAGAMLLAAYIEWGRAHADWVCLTLEADTPVKADSLLRRGFRAHERQYLLEVGA